MGTRCLVSVGSWEGDLGLELVRWTLTIIYLSRHGFKEAMMTDLLAYIRETKQYDFQQPLITVLDYVHGFRLAEVVDILSSSTSSSARWCWTNMTVFSCERYLITFTA